MGCLNSKLLSDMGVPVSGSKPRPPQVYQPQPYQRPQAYPDQGFYQTGGYGGYARSPFMETAAPDGGPWTTYVNGFRSGVDYNGRLEGPWAECIAWCMFFELTNDWRRMPEYSNQPGPVQGVMAVLEQSMRDRPDGFEVIAAAQRLEQGCREAARMGRPLPVIYERVPSMGLPMGYEQKPTSAMVTGRPVGGYAAPPYSGPPGFGGDYGPNGGYGGAYGQPTTGGGAGGAGGGFGKMAMAAAGGAVAGAGAAYMLGHAGDIADGVGDAVGFVGHGIQDVGAFAGHAVEDVGDFVGDAFEDIGDLF